MTAPCLRLLLLALFFFGVLLQNIDAQLPDSIAQALNDSLILEGYREPKGIFYSSSDYPNPKKALIYGLVFPGGGQIYNKKWWKLPLVYGSLGVMGWAVQYNSQKYLNFKRNYRREVRGLPHDYSSLGVSSSFLKTIRDRADKRRQLSYVGFVGVYVLVLADAFVDAHLSGFDVNEDLSLEVGPFFSEGSFYGSSSVPSWGIRLWF